MVGSTLYFGQFRNFCHFRVSQMEIHRIKEERRLFEDITKKITSIADLYCMASALDAGGAQTNKQTNKYQVHNALVEIAL